MAFDYYYSVSLSIVHPTVDPTKISAAMPQLHPRIQSMAGTERRNRLGQPLVPRRSASLTHWLADLHVEDKLFSVAKPISEFLREKLAELEVHRDLFVQLEAEGEIVLRVGWFGVTTHSADVLSPSVLRKLGELGIGIELNFYGPDEKPEVRQKQAV
jgi:hypothetical protein